MASAVSPAFACSSAFAWSGGKLCANETEATSSSPTTGRILMDTPLLVTLRATVMESSFRSSAHPTGHISITSFALLRDLLGSVYYFRPRGNLLDIACRGRPECPRRNP